MKLNGLRIRTYGIAGVVVITGLLAGCGGSSDAANPPVIGGGTSVGSSSSGTGIGGSSSSGSSSGGSTAIQGVATPSSVSVVTAN
jgi:hypothetical protein